ncbi:hypothetical protein Tco_0776843 [Tanacetum coccineum]
MLAKVAVTVIQTKPDEKPLSDVVENCVAPVLLNPLSKEESKVAISEVQETESTVSSKGHDSFNSMKGNIDPMLAADEALEGNLMTKKISRSWCLMLNLMIVDDRTRPLVSDYGSGHKFTICAGSSNGFYWLCYIPTGRLCWLKKVQISDSFATTQQQSVTALVTDLRQKYGH